jgi:adenine deaminase
MNMSKPIRPFSKQSWKQLIEVSRFQRPATAWIRAGQLLNVYTGEVCEGHIAISQDRIAYVGGKEPLTDEQTVVIDAADLTVVPGYIEPHTHPFQLYNPLTLAEFALSRGTTTLIHDNLNFFQKLEPDQLDRLFAVMYRMPVKNFWWARLDPQTTDDSLKRAFTPERVKRMLQHPLVLQAGELTAWRELLDGAEDIEALMYLARLEGKPIETHNPGASAETLNAVTAAGVTCCHESITAEEVLRRLRLGLYAALRHSSIRPDLPDLVRGLLPEKNLSWSRFMLTTDGSAPFFFAHGFTDFLIRLAIENGVPPVDAYRMATLNPAVYYGLDQELGGIAPGRLADILFLEDLAHPTPVKVMAEGNMAVEQGRVIAPLPEIDWAQFGIGKIPAPTWKAEPEWFRVASTGEKFPVADMINAAILSHRNESLPERNGAIVLTAYDDYLYAALLDRQGKWICTGIVKGFGNIHALASTYTLSQDIIVLGKDAAQMAQAVNRIMENGGGVCLMENGRPLFELSLPLMGGMSLENMDVLIARTSTLVHLLRERGHRHEDPIYSLLFFSATHLPSIRFTRKGLLSVKTGTILIRSRELGR